MPVLSLLPNCHPSDPAKCRIVICLGWRRNSLASFGLVGAEVGLTEWRPLVGRTLHCHAAEGQYSYLQTYVVHTFGLRRVGPAQWQNNVRQYTAGKRLRSAE